MPTSGCNAAFSLGKYFFFFFCFVLFLVGGGGGGGGNKESLWHRKLKLRLIKVLLFSTCSYKKYLLKMC